MSFFSANVRIFVSLIVSISVWVDVLSLNVCQKYVYLWLPVAGQHNKKLNIPDKYLYCIDMKDNLTAKEDTQTCFVSIFNVVFNEDDC